MDQTEPLADCNQDGRVFGSSHVTDVEPVFVFAPFKQDESRSPESVTLHRFLSRRSSTCLHPPPYIAVFSWTSSLHLPAESRLQRRSSL